MTRNTHDAPEDFFPDNESYALCQADFSGGEMQTHAQMLGMCEHERSCSSEKCCVCRYEQLERVLLSVVDTFESAVRAFRARGAGGQQVSFHGDFCNVNPSTVSRMEWWSKHLRSILEDKS